ncbi:hypothetical protein DPMN_172032 [Dreissena polymorpha]|uniref:Uncharacterized protein n=1 Tax=Dreissena polymorpha TaxID=45954 RepID=A0A9D4DZ34_DREPO|nr:hypothetical protein DPMN_172032 [Dreissena polymorpha]
MAPQRPTGGAPGLEIGPCIVEIDRIVIRDVQYQYEVNRCRNEEVIVKGNFRWAWPMCGGGYAPGFVMGPCILVIRVVQYQFEENLCRNEEVIVKGNFGWAGSPQVEIDRIVIRDVQYQFEENLCRNEEVNFQGSMARTDRQTDTQTAEITTISPRFSKSLSAFCGGYLVRVWNASNEDGQSYQTKLD